MRLYAALTRRLPRAWGVGAAANVLKRVYARKPRPPVEMDVHGFRMRLDPDEYLDRELIFTPQLYDREMLDFLRGRLKPGDDFLDAGANVGVFSLVASRLVGTGGRVLAVDADPRTFEVLRRNLDLNDAKNVVAVNEGLGEREETLLFSKGPAGMRGVGTFIHDDPSGIPVPCRPLWTVMQQHGFRRLAGAKLDIEGFEFRVLRRFLEDAPREAWPGFVLVERLPHAVGKAGGDVVELLRTRGYRVEWSHGADHIMTLGPR